MSPITRALVIDWETSGLRDDTAPTLNYVEGPQGIELGAVIVDLPSWDEVASFECRVRFMGIHSGIQYGSDNYRRITWEESAEKIHGIRLSDLLTAPPANEVVDQFLSFVRANHDPATPILMCGQNPQFDRYFLKQLLFIAGRIDDLRLHYRMLDGFTAAYMVLGCQSSDEFFRLTSGATRNYHTALGDARLLAKGMKYVSNALKEARIGNPPTDLRT